MKGASVRQLAEEDYKYNFDFRRNSILESGRNYQLQGGITKFREA